MTKINLKVLRVDQPIGEFYIGAIDSRTLNNISTVEVREFQQGRAEDIAGIQRTLSANRVKIISQYVNFDYATFPTSVVIAVDDRCVSIETIPGCDELFNLTIEEYASNDPEDPSIPIEKAAFIIDGQHRLAGLEHLHMDKSFELNVSIFVGADLADKAEIFSTVNLAQTKVNRSLVYDLFTYAKNPSPFKMAHEITIALDRDDQGPFFEKIKRLGTATPGRGGTETLSQATVVRGILRHFPKNPDLERNKGFLGRSRVHEPGESWSDRIFLPFYRENQSVPIFQIMTNYFAAVARRWPTAWDDIETGFILNRTNGYDALVRFLKDAYLSIVEAPRVVEVDEFFRIFSAIQIPAGDFISTKFPPGSSGASQLYRSLIDASNL